MNIADEIIDQLDDVVTFIGSISAVTTPLYWVSGEKNTEIVLGKWWR